MSLIFFLLDVCELKHRKCGMLWDVSIPRVSYSNSLGSGSLHAIHSD